MTDVRHLVNQYGRTRIAPDLRKPYVGRTQYTRTWYWKCTRCARHLILSGYTHAEVLASANTHARSWEHYYNRYSTTPVKGGPPMNVWVCSPACNQLVIDATREQAQQMMNALKIHDYVTVCGFVHPGKDLSNE